MNKTKLLFIALCCTFFTCSSGGGGGGGSTTYCVIEDSNECNASKLSAKQCSEKDGYLDIECPTGYDIIGGNQNNQNNQNNATSSSQVYYCPSTATTKEQCLKNTPKWTGNGKVMAIGSSYIEVGVITNGTIELTLPELSEEQLMKLGGCSNNVSGHCLLITCEDYYGLGNNKCTDNIAISPKDSKVAFGFTILNNNNERIGDLALIDLKSLETAAYYYFSKPTTIKGTINDPEEGENTTYNIDAQAGWSRTYKHEEQKGSTEYDYESSAPNLKTTNINNFIWFVMLR